MTGDKTNNSNTRPVATGLSSLIRHLPSNTKNQNRSFISSGLHESSACDSSGVLNNVVDHSNNHLQNSSVGTCLNTPVNGCLTNPITNLNGHCLTNHVTNVPGSNQSSCHAPNSMLQGGVPQSNHYNYKEPVCVRLPNSSSASPPGHMTNSSHTTHSDNETISTQTLGNIIHNPQHQTWKGASMHSSNSSSLQNVPNLTVCDESVTGHSNQFYRDVSNNEHLDGNRHVSHSSLNDSVYSASSFQMKQQDPVIVALRLEEASIPSGHWQFDLNDMKQLMSCFGMFDCVNLLELPVGNSRAPDCAIAQFSDTSVGSLMVNKLNGFIVPGIGKLNVISFPSSLLNTIPNVKDGLESFILFKLQENYRQFYDNFSKQCEASHSMKLSTVLAPTEQGEKTIHYLLNNLNDKTPHHDDDMSNGIEPLDINRKGNVIPNHPHGLNSTSPAVLAKTSFTSTPATMNIAVPNSLTHSSNYEMPPFSSSQSLRKYVCRLELIDLFSFYPDFDVPAFIIGNDDSNIKYVLKEAQNRVDIDLVGLPVNEASVAERLHLTVTSFDKDAYNIAVETLEDLLQSLCQQFTDFCIERNGTVSATVGFRRHKYKEGPDGQLIYLGHTDRPKPWLTKLPAQAITR
jgi:hypothetical protein